MCVWEIDRSAVKSATFVLSATFFFAGDFFVTPFSTLIGWLAAAAGTGVTTEVQGSGFRVQGSGFRVQDSGASGTRQLPQVPRPFNPKPLG